MAAPGTPTTPFSFEHTPQLPELLATGADRGLPTLALLRSREQARARWPHDELPV